MQKIGVIGAGVMGKGVAQRFAMYGYQVYLYDIDSEVLMKSKNEIVRNLKFLKMMHKIEEVDSIISNVNLMESMAGASEMDFVIENVAEVVEVKQQVYIELEKVCKENCIYMVNTSCIPITSIAGITSREDKVIGVHFMNPVPMKNFAEVIKGWKTSETCIQKVTDLLKSVGIEQEVVNDRAGFVSNRLSHIFMNEAAYLVYEGVATAAQIDIILKKAFGHSMGPLETADLIGVDVVVDSLKVLYDEYQDPKFKVCPLMKQMVYAKKFGRKTGEGFYRY